MTVAIEAPFHLERGVLPHEGHPVDAPVATRAADAFIHMDAVVEINKVGEIVHPRPPQRNAVLITIANWFEHVASGPDLRMAVHAGCRGGQARERRYLDAGMAVATVDTKAGNVVFVTKRDRLRPGNAFFGQVGRTGNSS